jgi:hypothetical protein
MLDRLRVAVAALNEGDAEPFASLFEDMQACSSQRQAKRFARRGLLKA